MTKDVLIIGAGPVGLFAVHQCGMLGLSVYVADSLPEIGGQCSALYPEKPIYDIPAYPVIEAGELIHQLEKQAAAFAPEYLLGQTVTGVKKEGDLWRVRTSGGKELSVKTILIAAGAGAFGPNKPPMEGLEEYEGKSVFYMVRRRADFAGKDIVIAGGGDSAVDWAISLSEIAKSVNVVHRRAKFRAAPDSVAKMEELIGHGKIILRTPFQLNALEGENGILRGVKIADLDGTEELIAADILLPFYGLASDLGPITEWGLNLSHHTIPVETGTCRTNIEGIFAIGDVAHYEHKLKLILTGFADAAQAAHAIRSYIFPEREFHFEYSTTKGLPS